jgi:ferredoxin
MTMPQIDLTACQGHGRCYSLAPDVFAPFDADGHAVVRTDVNLADPDRTGAIRRAVQACPELAISFDVEG